MMMWYFLNLLLKLDHTLIFLTSKKKPTKLAQSILLEHHWHNKDLKKFKGLKKQML